MNDFYLAQAACVGGVTYMIRPGDTLSALAGRFGTTVAAILAANPGIVPTNLQIGQTICIPGATGPACPGGGLIYTIQPGDTLYLLAQRYGIDLATLLAANPGIDPARLTIGQTICIPNVSTTICLTRLRYARPTPPGTLFPAGVTWSKPATSAGGATTVIFSAAGLPEPTFYGDFDAYVGQVITHLGESYDVPLGRGAIAGQPVTWTGGRDVTFIVGSRDLIQISPYSTSRGVAGDPVLLRETNTSCA